MVKTIAEAKDWDTDLSGDQCSVLGSAKDVPNDFGGGSLYSLRLLPACNISMMILLRIH